MHLTFVLMNPRSSKVFAPFGELCSIKTSRKVISFSSNSHPHICVKKLRKFFLGSRFTLEPPKSYQASQNQNSQTESFTIMHTRGGIWNIHKVELIWPLAWVNKQISPYLPFLCKLMVNIDFFIHDLFHMNAIWHQVML